MIQHRVCEGVCVLQLDAPPLNAIGFLLLEEIRESIRRANSDGQVQGIVIVGGADHFSAGADVNIFREIAGPKDAVRTSRVFQEAFQEVEDSPKPVVAAVAGRVMGSALELAMACHVRVCATGGRFSMPEVNLGINPGAGGTGRLPRLVGVEPALKMLLSRETVDTRRALELGLVDTVCGPEELLECARGVLRSGSAVQRTSRRTDKVRDANRNESAFDEAGGLLKKVRPEIIAPRTIFDAVRIGLAESFQAGLRKEQEGFAECMETLATQNKIYLFFATRRMGKVAEVEGVGPAKIGRAAVIGMGSMGAGIAQALLMGGARVVVRDEDPSALERGLGKIRGSLERRVAQGKVARGQAETMLDLVTTTTGWEDFADADLVIESVFEDVATKRSVIARLEEVCGGETIIASNTSTISLDVLAEGMQRGERLIGMHFFNPAQRMPLVEIIRRETTPKAVLATALGFAKGIRKTAVVVRNREGFLVNRLFVPYLKEAFWLLEDGATAAEIDGAMVEFGFAMGPLTLVDMAGLDILVRTGLVMSRAFPRHGGISAIAAELVQQGHLGQKTASGVYRYETGDYTPRQSEAAERIIAEVRRGRAGSAGRIGRSDRQGRDLPAARVADGRGRVLRARGGNRPAPLRRRRGDGVGDWVSRFSGRRAEIRRGPRAGACGGPAGETGREVGPAVCTVSAFAREQQMKGAWDGGRR